MGHEPKPQGERRDPASPILRLGAALSTARMATKSGVIEVHDRGVVYTIEVANGGVCAIDGMADPVNLERAANLFSLGRPNVKWIERSLRATPLMDPARLIIKGVTARKDVFDPATISERIPLRSLKVDPAALGSLSRLPLSEEQSRFLKAIAVPTPVPMILWKRGLAPQEAASLILALNLLGLWRDEWRPGHLPRLTAAYKVLRRAEGGADDLEILGLGAFADETEQDRAFRALSFELHPDRIMDKPDKERELSERAFDLVNGAHSRLKSSRRKRPVRGENSGMWHHALLAAERSVKERNFRMARKHALGGLSLNPPSYARTRFQVILRYAA